MKQWNIIALRDTKEWNERAIEWFHAKWQVPREAYRESIEDCQKGDAAVPQWYIAVEDGQIILGYFSLVCGRVGPSVR